MGKLLSFPRNGASLSQRVLERLWQAKNEERNPHLCDDLSVAGLTVLYASRGSSIPHVEASYRIFGCHPDHVFQRIITWRRWNLGLEYSLWFDEAGNLRSNLFDVPDYDPTTGFLVGLPIQTIPETVEQGSPGKAPLRLVVNRTEIRDGDGRVLYHGEQLECGHFHTEFLDANPGKQRRRCQACKDGVVADARPTIVSQESGAGSVAEEAARLRILFA